MSYKSSVSVPHLMFCIKVSDCKKKVPVPLGNLQLVNLPSSFLGWLYLGNLSSFPQFGHLYNSTLPASHCLSSSVGYAPPLDSVIVLQSAQIGLSTQ